MDGFSWTMILAAAGIAVVHTALGPDHTLPFIMLARDRNWSTARTVRVTLVCGAGHVLSSLLLGGLGLAAGLGIGRFEIFEGLRGSFAAWMMVLFGFAYFVWGIRIALRRRAGIVPHEHEGHVHLHPGGGHHHRDHSRKYSSTTFWVLFTIFVLGPCEPLIPLFLAPASRGNWTLAILSGAVFGLFTLVTMVSLVLLGLKGIQRLPFGILERWSFALTGVVVGSSGLAVLFLGL
jgi:nickel/cobalt exporter